MNPFTSDKAPYAIALVISAIGWAFATLHGGLQDSLVATYALERNGARIVGTVTNLSKSKAIGPVRFMLACRGKAGCLADEGKATDLVVVAPTAVATNEFLVLDDGGAEFMVSLPPGGAIQVVSKTISPDADVRLLMAPNADTPEAIYLLPESHPVAWFVRHYYMIVLATAALFLAIFTAWLIHGLGVFRFKRERETADASTPPPPAL